MLHNVPPLPFSLLQLDVKNLGVHMMTIVGHKFGAPKVDVFYASGLQCCAVFVLSVDGCVLCSDLDRSHADLCKAGISKPHDTARGSVGH